MTNNVNGVNGAQGTPQPGQPQLTAEQQKLVDLGIPKEVVLKGEAAIQAYAAEKGIELPKPEAAAQAPVPVAGEKAPDTDKGLKVEKEAAPHPEAELRREGEKYRQITDQKEIAAAKNYANKVNAYNQALEREEYYRKALNEAKKKTTRSTIAGIEKEEARKIAQKNYNAALDEVEYTRNEMLKAKAAFKDDQGKLDREKLRAANSFNTAEATIIDDKYAKSPEERTASRQAARTEMDDYYNSKEGRAIQIAQQDRILNMDTATLAKELGGVSLSYANQVKDRAELKKKRLEKLEALKEVRVGEEDFKQKDHLDKKGYPVVTNMDEKTYNTARTYAATKGLKLPKLEKDENGKIKPISITGDQLQELQQLYIDAAGNFGGRIDLNERNDVVDNNRDITFRNFRHSAEKLNVDVQISYKTAAIAAGAVASVAMAGLPAMWNVVPAVAAQIIPGLSIETFIPGDPGLGTTGHYQTIKLDDITIPGKDGSRTFKWGKYAEEASIPMILGTLVGILTDLDPNELKDKKTLEDVVYGSIEQLPAMKNFRPNAKKLMTKVLTSDLTKEQKLAILQKSMGDEGTKLNPRELLSAYQAEMGFEKGGELSKVDEKVDLKDGGIIWDINQGDLDKDERLKGATLVQGNTVTNAQIEENQADGLAHDKHVVSLDKDNEAKEFEQAQLRDANGRLVNRNRINAKSQYIVADEKGETKVELGEGTPEAPDKIQFTDNTNGPDHHNEYDYKKLSPAEAEKRLKENYNPKKDYYELVEARDPKGNKITKTKGKVFELEFSKTDRQAYKNTVDEDGYTVKREKYTIRTPHYEMKAADNFGKSSPHYDKTGAKPEGVKPAPKQNKPAVQQNKPATTAKKPAATAKKPAPKPAQLLDAKGKHTIVKGDNLWKVTAQVLKAKNGKAPTNTEIYNAMTKVAKANNTSVDELAKKFKVGNQIDFSSIK